MKATMVNISRSTKATYLNGRRSELDEFTKLILLWDGAYNADDIAPTIFTLWTSEF